MSAILVVLLLLILVASVFHTGGTHKLTNSHSKRRRQ